MHMTVIAWVTLALVWGTTWLAISIGLQDLPPATFAGARFFSASLVIGAILLAKNQRLECRAADLRIIAITGLQTFFVGYGLQFWGQQYVQSGITAVVFASAPLLTMVIAHFRLENEQMNRRKILGALVGLAGVAVIFSGQLQPGSAMASR